MKNELHDPLDEELKKYFDTHLIIPEELLWEQIKPKLSNGVVSYTKYIHLRRTFFSTTFALTATVLVLLYLNTTVGKHKIISTPIATTKSSLTFPILLKDIPENSIANEILLNRIASQNIVIKNEVSLYQPTVNSNTICEGLVSKNHCPQAIAPTKEKTDTLDAVPYLSKAFSYISSSKDTLKNNTRKPKLKLVQRKPEEKPELKLPEINFNNLIPVPDEVANNNGLHSVKGKFDWNNFFKRISLDISLSPYLATRTLAQMSATENSNFDPPYFNKIENPQIVFSEGLDLGFRINRDWTIFGGYHLLDYQQESMCDALHRSLISANEMILYTSSGISHLYGSALNDIPITTVFNVRVNYNYMEIPITARYYWFRNLFITAGVSYAQLMQTKTSIRSEEYTSAFTFSDITQSTNTFFNAIAGIGLDFALNKQLNLEIGPELKWQINPLNGYQIYSHPFYCGIRTSCRIHL